MHHLCDRSFQPKRCLVIDEINGEPALRSPYLAVPKHSFNLVRDYKSVTVQREFKLKYGDGLRKAPLIKPVPVIPAQAGIY